MSSLGRTIRINGHAPIIRDETYHYLAALYIADAAARLRDAPAGMCPGIDLDLKSGILGNAEVLQNRRRQRALEWFVGFQLSTFGPSSDINDLRMLDAKALSKFAEGREAHAEQTSAQLMKTLRALDLEPAPGALEESEPLTVALEMAAVVRPSIERVVEYSSLYY